MSATVVRGAPSSAASAVGPDVDRFAPACPEGPHHHRAGPRTNGLECPYELAGGRWVLDPRTRIQVWVWDD